MLRFSLILVLSIFCSDLFSQGLIDGFMKEKGNIDLASSFSFQTADNYFAGKTEIPFKNKKYIGSLFVNAGISNKLNVIANFPLINGILQDGALQLKYNIFNKNAGKAKLTFIAAAGISAPLYRYKTEIAEAIGQRATTFTPSGLIQLTFLNCFFINVRGGYNYSFSPVPPSVSSSGKIGYFKNKFYADAWYDMQDGIDGKDYRGQGDLTGQSFREYGVSYKKIGGVIYYQFTPKTGFALGGDYTLSGRNFFNSQRISFSWVFKI